MKTKISSEIKKLLTYMGEIVPNQNSCIDTTINVDLWIILKEKIFCSKKIPDNINV